MRTVELRRLLGAAVLWVGAPVAQTAAITLTLSDITGPQTFLNENVGYAWYLSLLDSPTHDLAVLFAMKRGATTAADAVASIYRMDTNALLGAFWLTVIGLRRGRRSATTPAISRPD